MAKREKRNEWIDQKVMKENLLSFFATNDNDMNTFGRTVNQTFENFGEEEEFTPQQQPHQQQ